MLRPTLALALALPLLACDEGEPPTCLPAARDEPEPFEVKTPTDTYELLWQCPGSPPAYLLDGSFRVLGVWVEGETCDACDLERIAGLAAAQVCSTTTPPRLLCGPLPRDAEPWERKGCYFAVAESNDCFY